MRLSICYTLMQLPGTILVILGLYFTMDAGWLSELSAALILCAWLLKDVVLYPYFRQAMRKGPSIGNEAPAGQGVRASADISGSELVRIQGGLADSRAGEHLPRGIAERTVGDSGPTLQVAARIHEKSARVYPEHSGPDSGPAA